MAQDTVMLAMCFKFPCRILFCLKLVLAVIVCIFLVLMFQEKVSGGLIEQIESVLLTENQLGLVWQDIRPDL